MGGGVRLNETLTYRARLRRHQGARGEDASGLGGAGVRADGPPAALRCEAGAGLVGERDVAVSLWTRAERCLLDCA